MFDALRAGASGFVALADNEPDDLIRAIEVVAAGDLMLAPSVTRRLVEEFASRAKVAGRPRCSLRRPTGSGRSCWPRKG